MSSKNQARPAAITASSFLLSESRLSRRDILRAAAGAAAGMLVGWSDFAAGDEISPAIGASGCCTLGFSTYGMQSMTAEESLRVLSDIGFDAVELAVRQDWDSASQKLSPARRAELRKLLEKSQLRLTSLMEHVHPTSEQEQKTALERLRLAAGVAHDLSPARPPLIQTVLGQGKWEELKTQLRDRLGQWAELAEATETTIALKPHRGGVVSQPSEAVWLIEQLGKPRRLALVYDYSHYAFRDLTIKDTIATALPYTRHVAIKDAVQRDGKVVFELPGQAGTIDFPALFKQLAAGGYQGDFNCEVSGMVSGKPGYNPIEAARVCYANMAQAMEQAGVKRPA